MLHSLRPVVFCARRLLRPVVFCAPSSSAPRRLLRPVVFCAPSFVLLPSLLLMASLLVLLLAAPNAHAGSYVGAYTVLGTDGKSILDANGNTIPCPYTGGNYTVPGPNGTPSSFPYKMGNTQNLASGYGGDSGGQSASCTGKITTSYQWIPDSKQTMTTDPPPSQVIVAESCSVEVTVVSPAASGTYDTGISKSGGVSWSPQGSNTASATDVRYSVQPGGASMTLSPSVMPTAVAAAPGDASSVRYTATIYPVAVIPSGATKDSSGNYNILVGQNCTPYLSIPGLPSALTVGWPTWTVSGDTYTSFDIGSGQSTGQAVPFPDPNANISLAPPIENPTFFWKDDVGNPATVQGWAILYTDPAGGLSQNPNVAPSAVIGSVSASQQVQVWVPDEFDYPTSGTPNPQLGIEGIEDGAVTSGANHTDGYDLEAAVVTPAFFTQGETQFGSWAWLQLCQVDVSAGGGSNSAQMTAPDLDSSFPYNPNANAANGVPGQTYPAQNSMSGHPIYKFFSDTPSEGWGVYATNFAFNNNFSLYVMYQPPNAGNGVNWVPLDLYSWGYSANLTRPSILSTNWLPNPPGVVESNGKSLEPSYPTWNDVFKP